MEQVLLALFDSNKPNPPDPSIYRECEDCRQLTNNSSIAWPKEKSYRFVCVACRYVRKMEQDLAKQRLLASGIGLR